MNYFRKTKLLNEIILFHFVGIKKPFFKLYMNNIYHKYFKKSPWSNKKIKLIDGTNASDIRIASKDLRKNKHYIAALKLKLLYILNKLHLVNSFK